MKRILSKITIVLIIAMIISMYITYSFGVQTKGTDGSGSGSASSASSELSSFNSINEKAKGFIKNGAEKETISQSKIEQDMLPLARILMGIAVLVLLSVGAILGVKYMISGADEKANIKEKLIWYVVSAVLIFGAVAIFNIVINVLNKISD
jgi:hypothetical protein